MNHLEAYGERQRSLPAGLTLEKPATSLASLTLTDGLAAVAKVVLTQWKNRAVFAPLAKHGIHPVRQLLFHGPPGNGKTTAAQWLAQRLEVPLYRARCEQIVGKYLGETAANIGRIMQWLDGSPSAVILLDEIEQLFPSRGEFGGSTAREVTAGMTVFWQYLDRWTSPQLFVLATNLSDKLDAALKSRIELQLEFGPPTCDQARKVVDYWAEILHEQGGPVWSVILKRQLDEGQSFASFRQLWQSIQHHVLAFVTEGIS